MLTYYDVKPNLNAMKMQCQQNLNLYKRVVKYEHYNTTNPHLKTTTAHVSSFLLVWATDKIKFKYYMAVKGAVFILP